MDFAAEKAKKAQITSRFSSLSNALRGKIHLARRVCSGGPAYRQTMLEKAKSLFLRLFTSIRALLAEQNGMT